MIWYPYPDVNTASDTNICLRCRHKLYTTPATQHVRRNHWTRKYQRTDISECTDVNIINWHLNTCRYTSPSLYVQQNISVSVLFLYAAPTLCIQLSAWESPTTHADFVFVVITVAWLTLPWDNKDSCFDESHIWIEIPTLTHTQIEHLWIRIRASPISPSKTHKTHLINRCYTLSKSPCPNNVHNWISDLSNTSESVCSNSVKSNSLTQD
jgi:hypothetical protein